MADTRPIAHRIEAVGAWLLFGFFRLLPIDAASALGGWIARAVGPHLGASKRADLNLRRAMPELGADDRKRIIAEMWDNLGRVVAEYPHLAEIEVFAKNGRVEVTGDDAIRASRAAGHRHIFFSAHLGNWEVASLLATQAGFTVVQIYRAANNPYIERMMMRARNAANAELVPKGPSAARRLITGLERGAALAMLVDQKLNDGIPVPFFGRDAMTAPALARLARRFQCDVVPVRVERIRGATFRAICEAPLDVPKTNDAHADDLALMTAVNATLERWIRADPAQWFWLHRRWPE